MTWLAVMVVPLTVPSTRTLSPFVMTLAEVELVPFRYVVEDAFLTVSLWPVDVEIAKLDVDTSSTVPTAPPAAGPERAFRHCGAFTTTLGLLDSAPQAPSTTPPCGETGRLMVNPEACEMVRSPGPSARRHGRQSGVVQRWMGGPAESLRQRLAH
jgi:hypothetical protein